VVRHVAGQTMYSVTQRRHLRNRCCLRKYALVLLSLCWKCLR